MTRGLVAALIAAVLAIGGTAARGDPAKELSARAAQPMIDLENRWVAALAKPDSAALAAILVDTYIDGDEAGGQSDKAGVLAVLNDLKLSSITMSQMHVYRYGNTAVVTGIAAQTGTFQGKALAPKIRFTDTLVLRNGTWQAAASQRTNVPD